ncbi:hypothetical protein [Parvularcula lutaonensis]|uniref:Uncharacterized protein n=1 Tax=Parvularcula lutaonensis TaxID=491923 RepID=A0ABV7MBC1_9PROT|nr:hypothetical protein [Parvularcula lutaonensis]GGY46902.1 hypothetical protein GCM10007148_15100 [Parvularcula lutaonensis]
MSPPDKKNDHRTGDLEPFHARDLRRVSDKELLGPDYKEWLRKRRSGIDETLRKGRETRSRAEKAIEDAERMLGKSEEVFGDDKT